MLNDIVITKKIAKQCQTCTQILYKTCHRDRIASLLAPCQSHKRKNSNILVTPTPMLMPTPGVVQ